MDPNALSLAQEQTHRPNHSGFLQNDEALRAHRGKNDGAEVDRIAKKRVPNMKQI